MMRFIHLAIMCLVLATMATAQIKLTIVVDQVSQSEGKIMCAFYANQAHFLRMPSYAESVPATTGSTTIEMNLPKGNYAIALFQDENNNNRLDLDKNGIPTEPYGFSNNVEIVSGPPSFEACKFNLDRDKTIHIHLSQKNQ